MVRQLTSVTLDNLLLNMLQPLPTRFALLLRVQRRPRGLVVNLLPQQTLLMIVMRPQP
jgi:hypothetical protein